MKITVQREGDVALAVIYGNLIVANRQELKAKVTEAIEEGARRVVIDFDAAAYIDNSGLGILVTLSKMVRDVGGEMVLVGMNDDLKILFEMTKLDTLFQMGRALEDVETMWGVTLPPARVDGRSAR